MPATDRREIQLKRREAKFALAAAVGVALALLAVFAVELSDTQAKSRRDVIVRVHQRAVIAAALIDSLFGSVSQQTPQYRKLFGARAVSPRTLDRHLQGSAYLALLDQQTGRVLSASGGFTPQARADVNTSTALDFIRAHRLYGLGNAQPYTGSTAIDFAVTFATPYGKRVLVTGFRPSVLSSFIASDLSKIPGVRGGHNYLIDGNNTVLASTNRTIRVGHRFTDPAQLKAMRMRSGDAAGQHYDQVRLANSTWRIVLAAPQGALFAGVSGLRKWVPWAIFVALSLVALLAIALGRRLLRSSEQLQAANVELERVNGALKDTNDQLERRAAELARSNGELEHFASIASHDLQEPLRKVRTFTQQVTVIESGRLSEKGQEYLARANSAAERMQRLIEDLLRFSRVATHGRAFVPVDLMEVSHQVTDDLEVQITRSGAVIHIGDLPTISADPLQMRQLLQNLISNGIKFQEADAAPVVWIEAQQTEDATVLSVRDNGIGFDPRYERRIFRVFERLHGRAEYPGTGIGLALCRKIVERHGGTIAGTSHTGQGATFTVTLPLDQPDAVNAPVAPVDEAEREAAHVGA
jgi:signal transduction histidine kinase